MNITDAEFQNRRDVMRMAPWLDMPLLRKELLASLQSQLDNPYGFMEEFASGYRKDIQAFCREERSRIPHSASARLFITNEIKRIFPATATDAGLTDAVYLICSHIMQLSPWQHYGMDDNEEHTPGETPHRTAPEEESEEDDYPDDYDEEESEESNFF